MILVRPRRTGALGLVVKDFATAADAFPALVVELFEVIARTLKYVGEPALRPLETTADVLVEPVFEIATVQVVPFVLFSTL